MNIIENIKDRVKQNIKTIVLPEADDIRTLQAAKTIQNEGFAKIILIDYGNYGDTYIDNCRAVKVGETADLELK